MIDRSIPEAMSYVRAAEMHRDSAGVLLDGCPPKAASLLACECVYIVGYVVECGLKALVVSNTTKPKRKAILDTLKYDVKHNLWRLRQMLVDRGMVMPKEVETGFQLVHAEWDSELRYAATPWRKVKATKLRESADLVFDWAVH